MQVPLTPEDFVLEPDGSARFAQIFDFLNGLYTTAQADAMADAATAGDGLQDGADVAAARPGDGMSADPTQQGAGDGMSADPTQQGADDGSQDAGTSSSQRWASEVEPG